MARFVVDIKEPDFNTTDFDITSIFKPKLTAIEDALAEVFPESQISVKCIDNSEENQFHNKTQVANGYSNEFTTRQIKRFRQICNE
jgi:hypothetical protein